MVYTMFYESDSLNSDSMNFTYIKIHLTGIIQCVIHPTRVMFLKW